MQIKFTAYFRHEIDVKDKYELAMFQDLKSFVNLETLPKMTLLSPDIMKQLQKLTMMVKVLEDFTDVRLHNVLCRHVNACH